MSSQPVRSTEQRLRDIEIIAAAFPYLGSFAMPPEYLKFAIMFVALCERKRVSPDSKHISGHTFGALIRALIRCGGGDALEILHDHFEETLRLGRQQTTIQRRLAERRKLHRASRSNLKAERARCRRAEAEAAALSADLTKVRRTIGQAYGVARASERDK